MLSRQTQIAPRIPAIPNLTTFEAPAPAADAAGGSAAVELRSRPVARPPEGGAIRRAAAAIRKPPASVGVHRNPTG